MIIGLLLDMSTSLRLLRDVDQFVTLPYMKSVMNRMKATMRDTLRFAEQWANSRQHQMQGQW